MSSPRRKRRIGADPQAKQLTDSSGPADQQSSTSKAAMVVLDRVSALAIDDALSPHDRATAALALLDDLARAIARVAIDLQLDGSPHLQESDC